MLIKLGPPVEPPAGRDGSALPGGQSTVDPTVMLDELAQKYGLSGVASVLPGGSQSNSRSAGSESSQARWYKATLPVDADILAIAEMLTAEPSVEVAEPDYLRQMADILEFETFKTPDHSPLQIPASSTDPLFAQQWHLPAAKVPDAWDYLESLGLPPGGSRNVVVAVIDSGVDYNHPDLAANMWVNSQEVPGNGVDDDGNGYVDDVYGADVITNSGDPRDDHGHGTHVAGIIFV